MPDQRRHRGARRPVVDARAARSDLRQRRHFGELLLGSEEGIASNILSSRLERLVAAGLLTREEATRGQRAAYSLTEAGIQTLPVMVAMGQLGLAHRDGTRELRVGAELLRDGGPELIERFMTKLHLDKPVAGLLGHVDEPAVVPLEGDGDGGRRAIAVLGDDEVRLAGAR